MGFYPQGEARFGGAKPQGGGVTQFHLVTDSTACIPDSLVKQFDIKVAPQVLIWGEEELEDGVDITPAQFYDRLVKDPRSPTTSQATIGSFYKIYSELAPQGLPILTTVISSKLSGTLQSAEQARADFPGARIEIIDSYTTAMALGYQVLAAARAGVDGRPFDEIVELARQAPAHTNVMFVVDTLEYLHRGGRIGGAAKLFGSALNIKPLLEIREGRVETLEKIRTKPRAMARLLDIFEQGIQGKESVRIAALHAAALQEAQWLLDEAKKRCDPVEAMISDVSPVVGTHAGPGTVGLAYTTGL
jgi:DegV family protein with EDD domain